MPFVQQKPPQIIHFLTLTQSSKIMAIDYCPNLICSSPSNQNQQLFYIIFVAKQGYICIMVFQQGCLISKHNIQIAYSYQSKITALVSQRIDNSQKNKNNNRLNQGIYIFVGFEDGTIAMYMLMENGNLPLVHIFKLKPKLARKQPVINVAIWKCDLIIACAYSIVTYIKIFEKDAQNSAYNLNPSKKNQMQLENFLTIQGNSCKLNIQLDKSHQYLYVYNEYDGASCLNISVLSMGVKVLPQYKKIQDSIKVLRHYTKNNERSQLTGRKDVVDVVMLGCSDDTLKFIDYDQHRIYKYGGFKNYPTCFQFDQTGLIWVGFLDGTIACFVHFSASQRIIGAVKTQKFSLIQLKAKQNVKLCETGIKKLIINGNLLVILDNDHNILLYDIIRQQIKTTSRNMQNTDEQNQQFYQQDQKK